MILIFFKVTRGGDQKFWISALGPPPNEFGQGVYSCLICHTWGLRPQVHEICPPQLQSGWVAAGIKEDISHEPQISEEVIIMVEPFWTCKEKKIVCNPRRTQFNLENGIHH